MRSNYQDFLVDRKGDFIVPNSSQWLRTFRGTIEGISAKRYAVVNLGWISINVQPKAIHIELRVASVSPVSLAALIFWLSELEAHRTVLTIHREKETYELFANHHALRDRLVGILREVEMRGHDRFERHTIGWNNKSQISSFERLNKMWKDGLRDAFTAFHSPAFIASLGERHILVHASDNLSTLTVCKVSQGYHSFDQIRLTGAQNLRIEDQYDVRYGWWIAEAYREVLKKGNPTIDKVSAAMARPQRPAVDLNYYRLMLPLSGSRGEQMLISTTIIDRSIER